jgi:hypothetical protein
MAGTVTYGPVCESMGYGCKCALDHRCVFKIRFSVYVTLDASLAWLIDLLEARRPVYIQTCLPYSQPYSSPYLSPFAHPFALIWAALHWYEPHSWGISSYTNCISNGPELLGSRCRYTCNSLDVRAVTATISNGPYLDSHYVPLLQIGDDVVRRWYATTHIVPCYYEA